MSEPIPKEKGSGATNSRNLNRHSESSAGTNRAEETVVWESVADLSTQTALQIAASGIPVFPCKPTKAPATKNGFKDASTDPATVKQMFSGGDFLIGVPTGEIVAIDVEDNKTAQAFEGKLSLAGIPMLVTQRTVSGGRHFLFRTDTEVKNLKVARAATGGKDGLLIETRGHGGYICTGGKYEWLRGDLTKVTTLDAERTEDVLSIARSFDQLPKERKTFLKGADVAPGDDYNRRGDWWELLMAHGWQPAGGTRWRRPGKGEGISADWIEAANVLHVFTSNGEPLEGGCSYSPFALFATLEHGGNFSEAAKALAAKGYGSKPAAISVQDLGQSVNRDQARKTGTMVPEMLPMGNKEPATTGEAYEKLKTELLTKYERRRFNIEAEPPEVEPVLTLGGTPVGTRGNVVFLGGQSGSGKSHSLAAAIASSFAAKDADCLGWELANPDGKAVIYLDFEQSEQDFYRLLKGACRRAGVESPPEWLEAFNLTGAEPNEAFILLNAIMEKAAADFGGVACVFIDGIADLINSPNDEQQAFAIVREAHALAVKFDTVLFSVLHHNAGADSFKMRGHIGSQAERKGETVLTVKRQSDGAIVIFSTKSRHAPIFEKDAPRFAWDDERGGFVSVASAGQIRDDAKAEQRRELATAIFAGQAGTLTHAEAVNRIVELEGIKSDAAKKRLGVLRNGGFVKICSYSGQYSLPLEGGSQ